MIDKQMYKELEIKYSFLSKLPKKLKDVIIGELDPDVKVKHVFNILINNKEACLFLFEQKMILFWMSKILFKKLPTIQIFNFSQINKFSQLNDKVLFIHSSVEPEVLDDNYEENELVFKHIDELDFIVRVINEKSTRLKK